MARRAAVGPATVNRELATLRRMLCLAHEWKQIQRVPRIRLLSGERTRDFVLSRTQEEIDLAACPQPLNDIAVLMLESGLRIGEAMRLERADVTLKPAKGARFGFLRVREGKSKNARRIVPLTDRANALLTGRHEAQEREEAKRRLEGKPPRSLIYVFANRAGEPYLGTSINIFTSRLVLRRSTASAFSPKISFYPRYAIQCLQGSENQEWTLSRSCVSQGIAASPCLSATSTRRLRRWSGLSSGCNYPEGRLKTSRNDCYPLQLSLH